MTQGSVKIMIRSKWSNDNNTLIGGSNFLMESNLMEIPIEVDSDKHSKGVVVLEWLP